MDKQEFRDLKSHKGKTVHRHSLRKNLDAAEFATSTTNRKAAERFGADERSIRLWKSQKRKLVLELARGKNLSASLKLAPK